MKRVFLSTVFLLVLHAVFSQGTGDTVKAVFVDEHNVKWFGTDLGLLRFDGTTWTAYNTRSSTPGAVTSIAYQNSESESELWIGTDNGVSVAKYDIDGISAATRFHTENSLLESNSIVDIVLDNTDTRFFATPIGVGVFEIDQWSWLENGWGPPEAGVPNYELLSLGAKNDTIYVGAVNRGAGRVINNIDGFSGASYYEIPWSGIIGNTVKSIFTDANGYQWFGTTEGFSYHTNQDGHKGWDLTLSASDGLVNDTVNAVYEDAEGNFWMATNGGVSKFNLNTQQFTNYTDADGLADKLVFDISEDQDGLLWFATANGVSSFDGVNFENYSTAEEAKDFINIIVGIDQAEYPLSNGKLNIYPNPSSSDIYIHFTKKTDINLSVAVYDMSGKKIRQLYSGYAGGGDLKVKWNLADRSGEFVPGGIYFVTVNSATNSYTEKVVILK